MVPNFPDHKNNKQKHQFSSFGPWLPALIFFWETQKQSTSKAITVYLLSLFTGGGALHRLNCSVHCIVVICKNKIKGGYLLHTPVLRLSASE